ncbi:unnamed protein product [Ambrosiozyma monospora]|uniref:Unnamed protein product n=1 Tax=Ambrosiozyma monospora TaxID=43982 RepID=A0ACB5U901_AMBMO|nr:unnamed protein product [Ambrosiozyma monospora]
MNAGHKLDTQLPDISGEIKLLIIDEASMLKTERVDYVDKVLRNVFHKNSLFGGIPVLLSADFGLLLPVGSGSICSAEWFKTRFEVKLECNRRLKRDTNGSYDAFLKELRVGDEENMISIPKSVTTYNDTDEALKSMLEILYRFNPRKYEYPLPEAFPIIQCQKRLANPW